MIQCLVHVGKRQSHITHYLRSINKEEFKLKKHHVVKLLHNVNMRVKAHKHWTVINYNNK